MILRKGFLFTLMGQTELQTFLKQPLKIVYYQIFNNPNDVITFEK